MRKCTGLRNKNRSGRSTYSIKHKSTKADKYGSYLQGRMTVNENIGGHAITKQLPAMVR
jgi:hypothetical protein